jgi:hypothetical protein
MKRVNGLAAAVVAMGLFVTAANAQTGSVQGMQLETVVCFNRTTGQTAPGTASSMGQFDCSAVGSGEIGILLLGAGGDGTPCDTVTETEPNDDQPQNIGTLSAACSLTVTGSVPTGYDDFNNPNPNADWDYYAFAPDGVSQLRLDVMIESDFAWGVLDAATNQWLQCQDLTCVIPAQTTGVVVVLCAQRPSDYTLTISGGAGIGSQSFGASTHGKSGVKARQIRSLR